MTIALIDKHPVLRVGLTHLLQEHFMGAAIFESDSAANFLKLHQNLKADIIIYGINDYSHRNTLSDLRMFRTKFRKSRIVIYDESLNTSLIMGYLAAGVNGYLSKAVSTAELIKCLGSVMREKKYIENNAISYILSEFPLYINQDDVYAARSVKSELTYRESEIAMYLCEGYRTSWIAKQLDRKPSTISTIKSKIFKKLEVSNVIELKKLIQLSKS